MHTNFERNIFVNCPFDKDYKPLRNVLIFTIVYCGYAPQIALAKPSSRKFRLEKILNLIKESKYGIHDLSRLKSKKPNEFYRLNMPFELGLDYASGKFDEELSNKDFLILGSNSDGVRKALSDINGLDIKSHEDNPEKVVKCIRDWFVETVGLRKLESASEIWYKYEGFNKFIFEAKFSAYCKKYNETKSEKLAKSALEDMTIPEFIDEIKESGYVSKKHGKL